MVSLTRIGYGPLTNFTNLLTKNPFNFQKTQRALFHASKFLHGPGQEIKMPSLSPTMNEGKIVKWLKKEGDVISPGDVLCDIETDKAVVSMETEEEGVLAKILVPENTGQIKVGSLIAYVVAEGEDWKNVSVSAKMAASPGGGSGQSSSGGSGSSNMNSSSSDSSNNSSGSSGNSSNGPSVIVVKMPALSPTMTEGTIIKWVAHEGSIIAPGDVLCEIQTDKAVISMETEEDGILAKILVPAESGDVKVGTIIALIVPEGEDWKNVQVPPPGAPVPQSKKDISKSDAKKSAIFSDVKGKRYGPAVRFLLASYQIQAGVIKPTGKKNMILKEDVLKYVADNKLQKKPQKASAVPTTIRNPPIKPEREKPPRLTGPSYQDIQLTNMRLIIAKRLMQSKKEIPHSYAVMKCNIQPMTKAKDKLSEEGIRVSMNDLITKATATALNIYPKANVLYVNNQIQTPKDIDVCVAVATDRGLFTPIVKSTNSKSVSAISKEIRELGQKAKTGKLKPEEFIGGTFTISNLGMFGVTHFKAIINPPQCGLLAVGTVIQSIDENLQPRKNMIMSLSYDRRALDEVEAAEFMATLKYVVENPSIILVGNRSPVSL